MKPSAPVTRTRLPFRVICKRQRCLRRMPDYPPRCKLRYRVAGYSSQRLPLPRIKMGRHRLVNKSTRDIQGNAQVIANGMHSMSQWVL
jgi:hypothetical protein